MAKNKKKVYIIDQPNYIAAFDSLKYEVTNIIEEADIVVFTGGEDVCPSLYNEEEHNRTGCNIARDNHEKAIFDSLSDNQLKVGICRGSQFLTVMSGGKLIQDCDNHGLWGGHNVIVKDKQEPVFVTSTHHQMMHPYVLKDDEYDLVAWSYRSSYKALNNTEFVDKSLREPEVVYYKNTKSLCVQGHPEYKTATKEFVDFFNELLDTYI